jgi:hypothetical protein
VQPVTFGVLRDMLITGQIVRFFQRDGAECPFPRLFECVDSVCPLRGRGSQAKRTANAVCAIKVKSPERQLGAFCFYDGWRSRAIEAWRDHYNRVRPHSALDYPDALGIRRAPRRRSISVGAREGASNAGPSLTLPFSAQTGEQVKRKLSYARMNGFLGKVSRRSRGTRRF